jgi:hypothetical protein
MANKEAYTAEQVIKALEAHQGLIYMAAQDLGCSGQTIYNYAKRYASVREAIKEQKERRKDRVELSLWKQINDGNIAAIIFYLKTQAKDRGYIERQELSGPYGAPVATETRIVEIVRDYGDKGKE